MLPKIKKIFNRLTLFDKLLIATALAGIVVFALFFFRKPSYLTVTIKAGPDSVYYNMWATQSVDTSGASASLIQSFYKGMEEKDGFGRTMAELIDINSYYIIPSRLTLYLKTKLMTTYSRSNNQYTYKGTPVLVGSKITLELGTVTVDGVITDIEGINTNTVSKKIIVDSQLINQNSTYLGTSGNEQFLADAIHVGDLAKDSQGNVVVKVIKKTVVPAQKTITTSDGKVFITQDPLRKDVYLTLEINADIIGGRYYIFKDVPILIAEGVPICTPTICYYPVVTRIDDSK